MGANFGDAEESSVAGKAHAAGKLVADFVASTVGGVSSAAVRSALVASSRSHRENGENGENTPVGTTGGTGRPGAQAGREEKAPTGTTGGTGPSGSTSRSARIAPSERTGRTGRTYPSGIASPDEPEGLCIAASGGDAQRSFAIVAFHRVFKELVVLAILYCQSSRILRKHTSSLLFQHG